MDRSRTTSVCSDGDNSDCLTKTSYPTITAKELFCLMNTITLAFESAYDFLDTASEDYCLEPELGVRTGFYLFSLALFSYRFLDVALLAIHNTVPSEIF